MKTFLLRFYKAFLLLIFFVTASAFSTFNDDSAMAPVLTSNVDSMSAFLENKSLIPETAMLSVIEKLSEKAPSVKTGIEKGVRQVARLWQETDGDTDVFTSFCLENYISDSEEKKVVFLKISDYMEAVNGHFNEMSNRLDWHVTIETGPILPIDYKFSQLSPRAHFTEDLYQSKIAFIIALNFPKCTLAEKETLGVEPTRLACDD